MLSADHLSATHARLRHFPAQHSLYWEGEPAESFYQVQAGVVRLFSFGQQRDFVHSLIFPGETFSENVISPQPHNTCSAETLTEAYIWVVERAALLQLLHQDAELHWQFTQRLSELLCYHTQMRSALNLLPAADQIMKLLEYYMNKIHLRRTHSENGISELRCEICARMVEHADGYLTVPFTRQQLADMLGLRVETVVRTVKELAETGRLRIVEHKIQYRLP